MTPEDYTGRQEKRVWAIEQLIRMEGCLDNRMYECADHAAAIYNTKNRDSLYTLWTDWKRNHPSTYPPNNRLQMNIMSHRFTQILEEDDYGDLLLTIPYELCQEMGWNGGTEVQYELSDDGTSFILKKVND